MKKIEYYTSKTCGPCQAIKPLINEIKNSFPIEVIDVDQNQELTTSKGIRSVPTFIFYNEGQETSRKIGTASINKRMLLEFFKK